jgi:hypothetical protein
MFLRTLSPTWICRMQNQAWLIEFSCKCDSMLHNAWLDIPCVFLCFIKMISDKHTWRRAYLIYLSPRAHSPLSRTSPCIKLCLYIIWCRYRQLHALHLSTCLDFYWFLDDELMFIGDITQVPPWLSLSSSGMVERYSSLFVSDTPAVLMVEEGTSLVLAWKLYL